MSQGRRRWFLFAAGALLIAPAGISAQSADRLRRVGLLFGSSNEGVATEMNTFVTRLRELGHVPGKTLEIVPRFADGVPARMPVLAQELIDEKVEVVFVPNTQGAQALQRLSDRVAIVFIVGDPVGAGLVASLSHPGRNATGFTQGASTIAAKRVELLKDSFPSTKKLGVLFDPKYPVQEEISIVTEASRRLGMQVQLE